MIKDRIKDVLRLVVVLFVMIPFVGFSQTAPQVDVQASYMQKIGHIPPIATLNRAEKDMTKSKKKRKQHRMIDQNFAGRDGSNVILPELEHQGPDKIRQRSIPSSTLRFNGEIPLVNREGITSNSSPNDPSGDIGKDHYVQAVNVTRIAVYDKEGELLDVFNANVFWGSIGFSSAGDPIVMYDQEVDRWIMTEFPFGNQMLFAISDSSDPLGSWTAYNFGTPSFPDYPKWAVWTDAYTVTTNEQGPGVHHLYLINKEQALAGADQVDMQRLSVDGTTGSEQGFIVSTPVDWTGLNRPPEGAGPYFMKLNDSSWGEVAEDGLTIFEVDIDWDNPNNTSVSEAFVPTSPYDSYPCSINGPGFACVPQPNGANGLDAIPEVIMHQIHYRNFSAYEAMVLSFVTDVTDGENLAGVRWVELRRSSGSEWTVYQEGTFGPEDGLDRYMSTICMDGSGNIGLAYSVSSEDVAAGVRYTGRFASDPLGVMTLPEVTAVDGGGSIVTGGRFGDYAHMSVDPTNDATFWFTTEYAGTNGNVRTRVVAFEMGKDTFDIGPSQVQSPVSSSSLGMETLVVEIKNNGLEPVSDFSIAYEVNGNPAVTEAVDATIMPENTFVYSFTQPVDMSAIGPYDFTIRTILETDENPNNDVILYNVTKLPIRDVSLVSINGADGIICGSETMIDIEFQNNSDVPLSSAIIEVSLNGSLLATDNWTGNLSFGETSTVTIPVTGLEDGSNELSVLISSPNGAMDEVADDNTGVINIESLLESVSIIVDVFTDGFPEETTWELVDDATGALVASGGPYDIINEHFITEVCVSPDACLTMTIFDSYGDGVNSFFSDDGNYTITDENGILLAQLMEIDFGDEESNFFCLGEVECDVQADFTASPETSVGNDGSILIEVTSGFSPFSYSIDGGNNFSPDNLFTGLETGDYPVVVMDNLGCILEVIVNVPIEVSTSNTTSTVNISIAPNPTNGLLNIKVDGLADDGLFLDYKVLNAQGQIIRRDNLVRYDKSYVGMLSIMAEPNANYFLAFDHPRISKIYTVIKQ